MLKNILLFTFFSFLISCKSEMVTIDKDWYNQRGKMINGEKSGVWIYSYDSGEIFQRIKFKNDLEKGTAKIYNKNGTLRQIGKFRKGEAIGLWKYYYDNTILMGEGNFSEGKQTGSWKWYFMNGQIHTIRRFEADKLIAVDFTKNYKGETIDKGTINNGTGTLLIYDMYILKDSIVDVINYKDGLIVN